MIRLGFAPEEAEALLRARIGPPPDADELLGVARVSDVRTVHTVLTQRVGDAHRAATDEASARTAAERALTRRLDAADARIAEIERNVDALTHSNAELTTAIQDALRLNAQTNASMTGLRALLGEDLKGLNAILDARDAVILRRARGRVLAYGGLVIALVIGCGGLAVMLMAMTQV